MKSQYSFPLASDPQQPDSLFKPSPLTAPPSIDKSAARSVASLAVLLVGAALYNAPLAAHAQEATNTAAQEQLVVPGELIVTLKESPIRPGLKTLSLSQGYTLSTAGLRPLSPISKNTFVVRSHGKLVRQAVRSERRFAPLTTEQASCEELVKSAAVASCSPNWVIHLDQTSQPTNGTPEVAAVPNDPRYAEQYAHQRIDSERGWNIATNSETVVVGVVDTGVDYNHPDLRGSMWTNPGEIPGNGIDDDGNGYIDDVYGWDSSHGYDKKADDGDPMDGYGHGTHVAGIIGASGNNSEGVVGVNWRAKIMALKFLGDDGWGSSSDAIEAIDYALSMKNRGVNLRVLSNSWGGGGYSRELEAAVERARSAGIIFVAAAGNFATNNDYLPQYPASIALDNVVSVAASDATDTLAFFSCFGGNSVHIAAPGNQILSTFPGAAYVPMSGTSMATPYVSGALALLLASQPQLDYRQAIQRLYATAKSVPALEGLTIGGKLLNVGNLLENKEQQGEVEPLRCDYEASLIPYSQPPSFDDAQLVMPRWIGGPMHPAPVELPFSFPFYNATYSRVELSVNGLITFGRVPESVLRHPFAPPLSIAPFHTSFYQYEGEQSPGTGVWVKSSPTQIDFQWRTVWPMNPALGMATITTSLFPDGKIRVLYSMNDDLAKMVARPSVVGIRGKSLVNSLTVSNDGFPVVVRGEMGLEYRPPVQCVPNTASPRPTRTPTPVPTGTPITNPPGTPSPWPTPTPPAIPTGTPGGPATPTPSPTNVPGVISLEDHQGRKSTVTRGKQFTFRIGVTEFKTSMVFNFSLGGKSCSDTADRVVTPQLSQPRGIWPDVGAKFSMVSVQSGSMSTVASIKGRPGRKTITNFRKACAAVAKAIRYAR